MSQSTLQTLRDNQLGTVEEKAEIEKNQELTAQDRELIESAYQNAQPLVEYN